MVDEDILSNLNLSNWNQETKETAQVVLAVDEIEDLPGSVRPTADKATERKYPGKPSSIKVAELLELVKGNTEKYIPKQEIVRESSDKNNPDIRYSRELTTDGRVVAVVDEDILSNLDLSNWNQETKETAQVVLAVDEIEDLPGSVHSMADKAVEKKYPGKSSNIRVAELLELVNGNAEKYVPKQEIVRESSDKNNPDIRYSRELETVEKLKQQNELVKNTARRRSRKSFTCTRKPTET